MEEVNIGQEEEMQLVEESTPAMESIPKKKVYRPIIGIVDRYIIRTFLGTYFFSILLIISVSIVFDINEKIDDFLKPEVSLYEIVFHSVRSWSSFL